MINEKRVGGLQAAVEHTGLSAWELRTGALSGKYPYMRIGGGRGKFFFNFDLLDKAIEKLMLENAGSSIERENQYGVRRVRGE